MAKYFTWKEFTKSSTADKLNIDNEPKEEATKDNILELMRFLDIVREAWTEECEDKYYGDPAIRVNSGYRCEELNTAIKGSKTSEHMLGTAADIEPVNGHNKEFLEWFREFLADTKFSQLINEKPDKNGNPSWIHFSIRGRNDRPYRCQYITLK